MKVAPDTMTAPPTKYRHIQTAIAANVLRKKISRCDQHHAINILIAQHDMVTRSELEPEVSSSIIDSLRL
jgi:hypothetical protein